MRLHYIIHAPFENLGAIETWIEKNNHTATGTHTYRGEVLPDVSSFDMLIIMGGPQSAVKLDKYPYLQQEIELTKQAVQANKPILGVCLGAQLIGAALGVQAERSPHKEIGVFPIEVTPEAENDPIFKQFPKQFPVMHWHNDMPGIPDGGVLLAKSAGCPRQAFRYGDRVYGFQFHLELTQQNVADIAQHCGDDLAAGQYVFSAKDLLSLDLTAINNKMHVTLDYLAQLTK